jgi:hypothetical protein
MNVKGRWCGSCGDQQQQQRTPFGTPYDATSVIVLLTNPAGFSGEALTSEPRRRHGPRTLRPVFHPRNRSLSPQRTWSQAPRQCRKGLFSSSTKPLTGEKSIGGTPKSPELTVHPCRPAKSRLPTTLPHRLSQRAPAFSRKLSRDRRTQRLRHSALCASACKKTDPSSLSRQSSFHTLCGPRTYINPTES